MNCAKCGLDLPPNVKQCPKCGMVNELRTPEAPKKVKPIVWAIAALALVAIVAIGVAAMISRGKPTVTQAPRGTLPPGNVVTAPPGQPQPGNVMTAPPGGPPPSAPTPPGVVKPKPPQAVVDYLEFVKKVEEHRQMLLKDTGDALTLMVGGQARGIEDMLKWLDQDKGGQIADPLARVREETSRQYKNWVSTLEYFDRQSAPDQCREFSGAYRNALSQQASRIGRVVTTLSKIDLTKTQDMESAFKALLAMKKDPKLQSSIDEAADTADAKLTQLVSRYDMEKPFDVPREQQTSGSIMGF